MTHRRVRSYRIVEGREVEKERKRRSGRDVREGGKV